MTKSEITYLEWCASANEQTKWLSHKTCLRRQRHEHEETKKIIRLVGHPVDDGPIQYRKYHLQMHHRQCCILTDHLVFQTISNLNTTTFHFYARQLYRQVLLRARISYGISVCPSVRLSQPGGIPSTGEIETPGLHHMVAWSI